MDDDWPTDADLLGMDPGERVVALAQWFRTRYAPPGSHATRADYDDWLDDERQPDDFATTDRGPVEALDVLSEKFGGMLDEELLQTVADILDRESTEWIDNPRRLIEPFPTPPCSPNMWGGPEPTRRVHVDPPVAGFRHHSGEPVWHAPAESAASRL